MIEVKRSMRLHDNIWEILPKNLQIQMIRNHIYVVDPDRLSGHYIDDLIDWCNENCFGLYYLDNVTFYFEEESDMVAFKVRWHGHKEETS